MMIVDPPALDGISSLASSHAAKIPTTRNISDWASPSDSPVASATLETTDLHPFQMIKPVPPAAPALIHGVQDTERNHVENRAHMPGTLDTALLAPLAALDPA